MRRLMKRKNVLMLAAMLVVLSSCGPKRFGCHGKRYCETPKQVEKNITNKSTPA